MGFSLRIQPTHSFHKLTSYAYRDFTKNDIHILQHNISYWYNFLKYTVHNTCTGCCKKVTIQSTREKDLEMMFPLPNHRQLHTVNKRTTHNSCTCRSYNYVAQRLHSVDHRPWSLLDWQTCTAHPTAPSLAKQTPLQQLLACPGDSHCKNCKENHLMYITSLSQIVLILLQFWSRKAKQRALYVYLSWAFIIMVLIIGKFIEVWDLI